MRKNIVAGNWKMNGTLEEGKKLASEVTNMVASEVNTHVDIVLIPPFVHLAGLKNLIGPVKNMCLGAQNCHQQDSGAFTGEVSAAMLKSCEISYIIIGHSERREYFGETDELMAEKAKQVLANHMTPIFCCGEKWESREAGNQNEVVGRQVEKSLFDLPSEEIKKVAIAYEPVWAIGTGKTASADQAQEMHTFIRSLVSDKYSDSTANEISILYGGSVKPNNAQEIFSKTDIDGGLIGGASLKPRSFTDIVKAIR